MYVVKRNANACCSRVCVCVYLVMRASGSYRVLFNTHLWAEMKCEKANQKSIRITAQDRESISVFLITVSITLYRTIITCMSI